MSNFSDHLSRFFDNNVMPEGIHTSIITDNELSQESRIRRVTRTILIVLGNVLKFSGNGIGYLSSRPLYYLGKLTHDMASYESITTFLIGDQNNPASEKRVIQAVSALIEKRRKVCKVEIFLDNNLSYDGITKISWLLRKVKPNRVIFRSLKLDLSCFKKLESQIPFKMIHEDGEIKWEKKESVSFDLFVGNCKEMQKYCEEISKTIAHRHISQLKFTNILKQPFKLTKHEIDILICIHPDKLVLRRICLPNPCRLLETECAIGLIPQPLTRMEEAGVQYQYKNQFENFMKKNTID